MAVDEEAGGSRIRWDCRRFGFYSECDGGRISTATELGCWKHTGDRRWQAGEPHLGPGEQEGGPEAETAGAC